jgi:hypothetical protein
MHHYAAPGIAFWLSISASLTGAAIAIAAGVWRGKRPPPQGFDFIASARRIRTAPVEARDDA